MSVSEAAPEVVPPQARGFSGWWHSRSGQRARFAVTYVIILIFLYLVLRRLGLDTSFQRKWLPYIARGIPMTLFVSAASISLAIVLALLGALGRISTNPVFNSISTFYISIIRGTPLIVQIFFVYLALPQIAQTFPDKPWSHWLILPATLSGILALGVNYGAYMTEIFRAGIQSIPHGQREAALALGMTYGQMMRRIILPQALRVIIPPTGNEFIAMLKDSALVSFMGVHELFWRAQKVGRQYFRSMETLLIAAAFYWMVTMIFENIQRQIERRLGKSERQMVLH